MNIEDIVIQIDGSSQTILNRMRHYNVPGLSLALVQDNEVAWSQGFGVLDANTNDAVRSSSIFQAASISKPISAIGFLRLVQDKLIGLDEDVNPHLNWDLPVCVNADPEWLREVTLRRLLKHNGGISGRGLKNLPCNNFGGFIGYPDGVKVPTLVEILEGSSPSNSPQIQLTYQPDTAPDGGYYSGAGYVLMTRLLEELTESSFDQWMKEKVLSPLEMSHSTFQVEPSIDQDQFAAGHDWNRNPIPGKRFRYPESAAAGLYSTPVDLCQFIILLNQKGMINGKKILEKDLIDTMVNESTGIFTSGDPQSTAFFYAHSGSNAGFSCTLRGYPNQNAGVVVMTNGMNGDALYNEIVTTISTFLNWDDR
ncbi:MAG: serine hydrolase domain-containing protein [Chloroflexota bacterium]